MNEKVSIHKQISSYAQEVSHQISKTMEADILRLINQDGYAKEELELCFYRLEPLRYSIRVGARILVDRWLRIDFKCEEHQP
jgi:hypothetical protein